LQANFVEAVGFAAMKKPQGNNNSVAAPDEWLFTAYLSETNPGTVVIPSVAAFSVSKRKRNAVSVSFRFVSRKFRNGRKRSVSVSS